jgi:hypothetical protein
MDAGTGSPTTWDVHLEVPPPILSVGPRSAHGPELLIDMPAESAVRLLLRSLLERAAHLQVPQIPDADSLSWVPVADGFRAAADRVNACLTLYADVLAGSVPPKLRRRLRALARHAERLHRADVQLSWLSGFGSSPPADDAGIGTRRDDFASARWLRQRALRRAASARRNLERAYGDGTALRRLGRRLGVYTTAVRLDDVAPRRSFAALTGELIREETDRLRKHLLAPLDPSRPRSARRALRTCRRLVYILDPVRVHVDGAAETGERLRTLQAALDYIADVGTIADAILRAGRRAGARHMSDLLRSELAGTSELEADAASASHPHAVARDVRPGLLALARQLRVEVALPAQSLKARWGEHETGALSADLEALSDRLAGY